MAAGLQGVSLLAHTFCDPGLVTMEASAVRGVDPRAVRAILYTNLKVCGRAARI